MKYSSYADMRSGGSTAMEAYTLLKENEDKINASSNLGSLLGDMVAIVIATGITAYIITRNYWFQLENATLWVSSPSGKTVRELPFKVALRVIRKRQWSFARVQPIPSHVPKNKSRLPRWLR